MPLLAEVTHAAWAGGWPEREPVAAGLGPGAADVLAGLVLGVISRGVAGLAVSAGTATTMASAHATTMAEKMIRAVIG